MSDDEQWPVWCCEYEFDGSRWGINIPAQDEAEARRRLRAIGMTGQVKGELMGTVDASIPGAGLFVRLRVAAHNWLGI